MRRLNLEAPGEGETRPPDCRLDVRAVIVCISQRPRPAAEAVTKRPPAVYVCKWLYSAAELPKLTAV